MLTSGREGIDIFLSVPLACQMATDVFLVEENAPQSLFASRVLLALELGAAALFYRTGRPGSGKGVAKASTSSLRDLRAAWYFSSLTSLSLNSFRVALGLMSF